MSKTIVPVNFFEHVKSCEYTIKCIESIRKHRESELFKDAHAEMMQERKRWYTRLFRSSVYNKEPTREEIQHWIRDSLQYDMEYYYCKTAFDRVREYCDSVILAYRTMKEDPPETLEVPIERLAQLELIKRKKEKYDNQQRL